MVVLTRLSKNKRTLTWPFLYELQLLENGGFWYLKYNRKRVKKPWSSAGADGHKKYRKSMNSKSCKGGHIYALFTTKRRMPYGIKSI